MAVLRAAFLCDVHLCQNLGSGNQALMTDGRQSHIRKQHSVSSHSYRCSSLKRFQVNIADIGIICPNQQIIKEAHNRRLIIQITCIRLDEYILRRNRIPDRMIGGNS